MPNTMDKIAIIPAYEPDEKLTELLFKTNKAGFITVVVNDGSGPEYDGIFEDAAQLATVLVHDENRGKGSAIKTALGYIWDTYPGKKVVCTLDSDGQHTIEDALRVCDEAMHDPGTLVIGERTTDEKNGAPLKSRFGNAITRAVFRLTTGVKVNDTQTGLRAFTDNLIPKLICVKGERYEYEMNMLIECAKDNIKIKGIPIKTIYINNNAGTHFRAGADSFRIYKDILGFSVSSFIGFLTDYSIFSLLITLTAGMGAPGIWISNITARVISASVNFTINRKYVFKAKGSAVNAAIKYFLLAACILLGNTFLLTFLVETVGMNRYAAKLITEIIFFFLSWTVQKNIIFKKEKEETNKGETAILKEDATKDVSDETILYDFNKHHSKISEETQKTKCLQKKLFGDNAVYPTDNTKAEKADNIRNVIARSSNEKFWLHAK